MAGGVDPTVALQVRPIGANQLDPLQSMERIVNIGRGLNEIRNQNARFEGQRLTGEIMAQFPGDPVAGIKAAMGNPITSAFAPDIAETHARTTHNLTLNAGAEQDQTQNALHGVVQGLVAVNGAMKTGGVEAAEQAWDNLMQRTRATVNPALLPRFNEGVAGIHAQVFQGTKGVDAGTAQKIVNGNVTNLLVTGGMGGDQMQFATGALVTRQLGNREETWRIPPDGSPPQLVSVRLVGLAPQITTGVGGQPVIVGGASPSGQPSGVSTVFPPNYPDETGVSAGGPLGDAGRGGIPFTPQALPSAGAEPAPSGPAPAAPAAPAAPTTTAPAPGPAPAPGGAGGAGGQPPGQPPGPLLPSSVPGAPQQPAPPPAPPTLRGPQVSPEAARPYTVGGGGTFQTTQELPPEAKQMDYALPNNRMPTTVPDGRAIRAPVFGDGTLGWDRPEDLKPTQRAWAKQQMEPEGELQKQYTADNATGGAVPTAQTVVAITNRMKHNLQTIAEDKKATAVFLSLGPKLGDRLNAAQWDQLLRNALAQAPDISKESRVALEEFVKDSNSLVIQSARQNLGQSHVAAESIARVAQTSPSVENSPFGALILSDMIKAQAQRTLDQNNFRRAVLGASGRLQGADPVFNDMHSADMYSHEVLRQYGLLPTGQFVQSKEGLDNFRRQVDSGFILRDAAPGIMDREFPGWRGMH